MPNRMIRGSICTSEKINKLTDFEFRVWVGLLVYVDDFGRGDARPAVIKGACFPLRDEITSDAIGGAVRRLAAYGCIRLYSANDGKEYLCFKNWGKYQRIRSKWPKFPAPDDSPQIAADCGGLQQNVPEKREARSVSEKREASSLLREAEDTRPNDDDDRPDFNTLEVYAANNLQVMSPRNMEELISFRDQLPDDLIRFGIDQACAQGVRKYAYVRAILNGYVEKGIRTIGEARAAEEAHRAAKGGKGYQQHDYKAEDFGDDFYYDPTKDYPDA